MIKLPSLHSFFFFNDTATTEIYTLSLHDALPIYSPATVAANCNPFHIISPICNILWKGLRSEEHTSELQSPDHLVCRLLLEKKKSVPFELKECYALTCILTNLPILQQSFYSTTLL